MLKLHVYSHMYTFIKSKLFILTDENFFLTFTVVHDRQYEPQYQMLRQDLPTENQSCLQQASIESSDDEWSDLSFYDLPDTLKVSEV